MESLISGNVLKPISDLGIVLIDKIEKATGWIFSTTTAKKEGYKNIIEEICIKNEYLEWIHIKYDEIIKLEDFGIMKREITSLQDEISFDLENEIIKFIRKPEKKGHLNLTKYANFYRFTHIGMEIIELINEEISGNQFKKLEKAFDYEYNVMLEKK